MTTAFHQVNNNAKSTTSGLNNTTDPVTFSVGAGEGSRFSQPGNGFWVTAWDSVTYGDPGDDPNMEVLSVTARSTDSLTASRAQLGTSNVAHAGTVAVRMLVVDAQIEELQVSLNAVEKYPFVKNITNGDNLTVPANMSLYVPDYLEISLGDTVELALEGTLEIG